MFFSFHHVQIKGGSDDQGNTVYNRLYPHTAIQRNQVIHQEKQRYIQYALAQDGYDESFSDLAHSLKLYGHGIAEGHEGHGKHHTTQEGCTIGDGLLIFNKKSCQTGGKAFVNDDTKQGKADRNGCAKTESISSAGFIAGAVVIGK